MAQLHNPHPGEILKFEFLEEIDMSQNHLADAMAKPHSCHCEWKQKYYGG